MVLSSEGLGRELTITRNITLTRDIFDSVLLSLMHSSLPDCIFQLQPQNSNLLKSLDAASEILSTQSSNQLLFCPNVLVVEACREGEVSSRCLKSSKPPSGQRRKCTLRHEGTQPWFVVHSVIEPSEQRPLHSGWGEGGVEWGQGQLLVNPHVELALTVFALKRQAWFLTTLHNTTTTLVSRGQHSLVAERISTSQGYTHDTQNALSLVTGWTS